MPRKPRRKCCICNTGSTKKWNHVNNFGESLKTCFGITYVTGEYICSSCQRCVSDHLRYGNTYYDRVSKNGQCYIHSNKQSNSDFLTEVKLTNLKCEIILFILR